MALLKRAASDRNSDVGNEVKNGLRRTIDSRFKPRMGGGHLASFHRGNLSSLGPEHLPAVGLALCSPDFRTEGVISLGDSLRVLEQTCSGSSEDKAANVRQVCHAPGLHVCHGTGVKELSEKPKTN